VFIDYPRSRDAVIPSPAASINMMTSSPGQSYFTSPQMESPIHLHTYSSPRSITNKGRPLVHDPNDGPQSKKPKIEGSLMVMSL
jgi:hypothetical protein